MNLQDFLDHKRVAELEALHLAWVGGEPPDDPDDLRDAVGKAMNDGVQVAERIEALTPQVQRVLSVALHNPSYVVSPDELVAEEAGGEPVETALMRLVRDGFFHMQRNGGGGPGLHYVVPSEVGDLAASLVLRSPVAAETVFSIERFTRAMSWEELRRRAGGTPEGEDGEDVARAELLDGSMDPERIEERIRRIEDFPGRELARRLVHEFGGVLTASQCGRLGIDGFEWNVESIRERLEENLLGTCLPLSLEEYGIGLMEPTAIAFPEVVEAVLLRGPAVEGGFERIAASGIDLMSDLAELGDEISRGEVRLTQKGALYKGVLRRLARRMVSTCESYMTKEELVGALLDVVLDLGLAEVTEDRSLAPTRLASTWEKLGPPQKTRKVLRAMLARPEAGEPVFHLEGLRRALVRVLASLEVGRWYDPMAVPFVVRNRYLTSLEKDGVKDRYQTRFQYAGPPLQSEPARMAWNLFEFIRKRLYSLGLVDLAFRGERVAAIRLTSLGAVTLGIRRSDADEAAARRIVVHSDFEAILFPQGRDDPLIHELDRFATRTKSENVYHFRIERDSVVRAVAGGATPDGILGLLESHGRNPVPQNVAYSIREWADRIRFISCERVFLLSAPDSETVDRVAELPSLRPLVLDRLSPTVLSLRERPEKPSIRKELEGLGVFLR